MSKKEETICGLDIGTTKICVVVGRPRGSGTLEVMGTGYAESAGLKKGVVVDLEQAAASIRRAAAEAELKSDFPLDWVTVGLSGDHIQSFNCHGAISIEGKHRTVTREDATQVIAAAQSIPLPADRQMLHVIPQEYFLDGRGGIQNPVGLTGSRLEADVHVVTCNSALMQNQINAVNRAQMRVRKIVLQQLASAEAVLTQDEKDLGSVVIDIGGGTTDIAAYFGNAIRATSVLPVGGLHFTRDLAVGLRTPLAEAERLKRESGTVLEGKVAEDETVPVPGVVSGAIRDTPRRVLGRILRERAVELLELVRDLIHRDGYRDQLVAGAVLTGGGSLLEGLLEVAEEVLEMPVRPGPPCGLSGLTEELSHPVYVTAIGLALFGIQARGGPGGRDTREGSAPWFVTRFLSWVGN